MKSLFIVAALAVSSVTFAGPVCPSPDQLNHYVVTKLRAESDGDPSGSIRIYYRLLKPFDASQPTLLVISGGPGADSGMVDFFAQTNLAQKYNILGFDHRGLGCTQIISRQNAGSDYEPGLYGMPRAADDMEAIRKDLLGDNGQWFVYGVSYGTFLGQQYITKYPNAVAGAILDSAFDNDKANDIARKQYMNLFVLSDAKVSGLFSQLTQQYPDLQSQFLQAIFPDTYTYKGRTQDIARFFQSLVGASDRAGVLKIPGGVLPPAEPMVGMVRQIICEEIWDDSTDPENAYYMPGFTDECKAYASFRNPMDFDDALTQLPMRVFIFGGQWDPVTPIQSMRKMKTLIPHAIMWENPLSGHGVLFQNLPCGQDLVDRFMKSASDDELNSLANSAKCQSLPASIAGGEDFYRHYISPRGFYF